MSNFFFYKELHEHYVLHFAERRRIRLLKNLGPTSIKNCQNTVTVKKYDLFRRVESYFFIDLDQFVRIRTNWFDFKSSYKKFPRFFVNLKSITENEIDSFLTFFGASAIILSDQIFKRKVVFFFSNLNNDYCIFLLFLYHTVYEFYYLVSHKTTSIHFLMKLAELINQRLSLKFRVEDDRAFTVRVAGMTEYIYSLMYENIKVKVASYNALKDKSLWLEISKSEQTLKFPDKFLDEILEFYFSLTRVYLRFFFFIKKKSTFLSNKNTPYSFLCKFFLKKNFKLSLIIFDKMNVFFHREEMLTTDFTQVRGFFEIFVVFFLRFFRKFFLFFFKVIKTPHLFNVFSKLYLKVLQDITKKFISLLKSFNNLTVINRDIFVYNYVFRSFKFDRLVNLSRFNLQLQKFPGSDGFITSSLLTFKDLRNIDGKRLRESSLFLTRFFNNFKLVANYKLAIFLLFRFNLIIKSNNNVLLQAFFNFIIRQNWLNIFTERTRYYYASFFGLLVRRPSFNKLTISMKISSYFIEVCTKLQTNLFLFFSGLADCFRNPAFYMVFRMMDFPKFEYVPIPLRVSSVIYDLFDITAEDNLIEDEDAQLEVYEDYLLDFEEEQADESDEEHDDWYYFYFTEDYEETEPTFFLLEEHLNINLHSNVVLKRKYSDDVLPLLASNINPESLVEHYPTPQRPFRLSYWGFLEDFFKYLYHEQHIIKSEYMLFFTDLWLDGVEDLEKFDKYFSPGSTSKFGNNSESEEGEEEMNFFLSFDNKFKNFYDLAQKELDDYFSKRIFLHNLETRQWSRFWFNFIQTAQGTTRKLLEKIIYLVYEFFAWGQYRNLIFNDRYTLIPYLGYSPFDAYPDIEEPSMFLSHQILTTEFFERPVEGFRVFNMLSFYDLNNMFLGPNYFADLFDPKYLFREGLNVSSAIIEDYFSDVYSTFVNRYVHSDIEPHLDIDYYEKFFDLSCDDYFSYTDFNYTEDQLEKFGYTDYYGALEPGEDNNDVDDFEDIESAIFGEGTLIEQRGVDLEKDDPTFFYNQPAGMRFSFETGEIFGINAANYKYLKDQGFIGLLQLKNFFVGEGLRDYQFRLENLFFEKNKPSIPVHAQGKKIGGAFVTAGIFSPTLKLFNDLSTKAKTELHNNLSAGTDKLNSLNNLQGFQSVDNSAILHNFFLKSKTTEDVNGFFFLNSLDQTISDRKYRIFYKFITIFMCRREDITFLRTKEPKIVFLLRFLLFSTVTKIYKFFRKVDLFNFFIYIFPAFFFFIVLSTFKKVYKLNSSLDVKSLCNYRTFSDNKFEAFYAAFCRLGLDDEKKMKSFFKLVLLRVKFFLREYTGSFSSYESRDLFFKKYSSTISFFIKNLSGMCCVVFFRKSDFFFTKDRLNLYTSIKDLELRGDFFSRIFKLSLSPSLRSYVSTLLDYYGDEKTFFSKLSDKDFLEWLRKGGSNIYEDTSLDHVEVLKNLKILRKNLEIDADPVKSNYFKKLQTISITAFKLSLDVQDYNFFESVLISKNKYKNKIGSSALNRSLEIETYLTDFEDFETEDLDMNDDWDEEMDTDEDLQTSEPVVTFDEHELLGDADQKNFEDVEYRLGDLYDDFFYEQDINTLPDSFEDKKTYVTWSLYEHLSQQSVKFRKNKIFYLYYLGEAFINRIEVVLRDYLISFYRYYLDNSVRIKDFTVRFDKILDSINVRREAKSKVTTFVEDFNLKYTRNNAILQTYIQRNLLDDLDHYLQPEYDYEEFDFVYSDINQVTNNVSAFDHLSYDNLNQKAHFDYFALNFTFLEAKRTKTRLIKMLYNEFHAVPVDNFFAKRNITPAISIDARFFWFEAETLMVRRVCGFYYSGFFFRYCDLRKLNYSARGSFRLLKFVLLRVRLFFLRKLRSKMDFLKNLRVLTVESQRRKYLRDYFLKSNINLADHEVTLLFHYVQLLDANNNFFAALDIFDLYKLLKLASFLKYKYTNALTSFGYILLVQELVWLNFTIPNLSRDEFRKKFFEYFNCLKNEEKFFYKNYYSLFQLYSKYGINEAHYYLESKIKYQEVNSFLLVSIPKNVKIYQFIKDLLILLVFFMIIIFLCSEYTGFTLIGESFFNYELEYEEEPYEEPFEFKLNLFPETDRARKREFITEFYNYFMRLW